MQIAVDLVSNRYLINTKKDKVMIAKILVNPETLEVTFDDPNLTLNHVKKENGLIEIEVSKQDPEVVAPYVGTVAVN